mgnify:FL=1
MVKSVTFEGQKLVFLKKNMYFCKQKDINGFDTCEAILSTTEKKL